MFDHDPKNSYIQGSIAIILSAIFFIYLKLFYLPIIILCNCNQ